MSVPSLSKITNDGSILQRDSGAAGRTEERWRGGKVERPELGRLLGVLSIACRRGELGL
jgi:hypothetical protein